jgi:hypothetical protein
MTDLRRQLLGKPPLVAVAVAVQATWLQQDEMAVLVAVAATITPTKVDQELQGKETAAVLVHKAHLITPVAAAAQTRLAQTPFQTHKAVLAAQENNGLTGITMLVAVVVEHKDRLTVLRRVVLAVAETEIQEAALALYPEQQIPVVVVAADKVLPEMAVVAL